MSYRRIYGVAWPLIHAIFLVGCTEQQKLFPVSGTVLIDGEPLPTGTIQFVPENGRPFASKIRQDGSFRLEKASVDSDSGNGVLEGDYRIGVSSSEILDEDTGDILRHVPVHYADYRTSDLAMKITEPQEGLVIELTWEGFEEVEEAEAEDNAEDAEVVNNIESEQVELSNDEPQEDLEGQAASEGTTNDTLDQELEATKKQ